MKIDDREMYVPVRDRNNRTVGIDEYETMIEAVYASEASGSPAIREVAWGALDAYREKEPKKSARFEFAGKRI